MTNNKIINDPVFGFIRIPNGVLYDIVVHRDFFRLSRIRQLGGAYMVYPGAQHTRFQHSLGAFYLMSKAVATLLMKGVEISDEEAEAVEAAILMHDIGHGPFSHVLEHTLMSGVRHEEVSLMIMEKLNKEMDGRLSLAIQIFKDKYKKHFLHQLISSQLDMDRLDYLRRDSFFTGVTEGNIGSDRIIDMLHVKDDRLVMEKKGIYSIENYLVSRRLMYWQVYLHKTSVAAEHVLINALQRAKDLAHQGVELFCSPALHFFLYNDVDKERFFNDPDCLTHYLNLDDNDIISALKVWEGNDDKILSLLSQDFIGRNIFKVEVTEGPSTKNEQEVQVIRNISERYGIDEADVKRYLTSSQMVGRDMYSTVEDKIEILMKDGTTKDISEVSDMLNVDTLSKKVRKKFFCYQR
ncbi:MAG: HD domain-containing protein [Bacteroidaceae bacterium]|nr:HD domain-containing protein [Bacteroidaceae bacterium]MBP5522599.1 HD domain-containing protein [Bacteroidaceae bacterium]